MEVAAEVEVETLLEEERSIKKINLGAEVNLTFSTSQVLTLINLELFRLYYAGQNVITCNTTFGSSSFLQHKCCTQCFASVNHSRMAPFLIIYIKFLHRK